MKTKIFKLLSVFVAVAMLGSISASAQNQALLDALVKKGYLTKQDATKIANETVVVKPSQTTTKTLSISGLIHSQYDYVATDEQGDYPNPKSTNRFRMRRVDLGATAQLGNGWSGVLNCRVETLWWRSLFNMLETAYVQKDVQWDMLSGSLRMGYQKVPFIREENTPCSSLKTVERSPMTNFFTSGITVVPGVTPPYYMPPGFGFTSIGLGNRYTGIFWAGDLDDSVKGLTYGLAVVAGGKELSYLGGQLLQSTPNQLGYFADVAYTNSYDNMDFTLGVNFGYQPAGLPSAFTTGTDEAVFGVNPYLELGYEGFSLMTELAIAKVSNGKISGDNCHPVGLNFIPSYKFNDEWEIVLRYSYLDTNGRGVNPSEVVLDGPDVVLNSSGDPMYPDSFNHIHSYYIGFNWYIMGDSVKLTAGYEHTQFKDRRNSESLDFDGPSADVNAVRARMQLLF